MDTSSFLGSVSHITSMKNDQEVSLYSRIVRLEKYAIDVTTAALAYLFVMFLNPCFSFGSSTVPEITQPIPINIRFAAAAVIIQEITRANVMDIGFDEPAVIVKTFIDDLRNKTDGAHLTHQAGIKADVRGPDDMKSPEHMEIDRFGVEAVD